MKTLIVIDFQKDFANPNGTLYVPGAEAALKAIVEYIEANHNELSDILFTVDWHAPNHCSFKQNGGIWPAHCVQFSEGAGIVDELIQVSMKYNIPIKVFRKGNVSEQEEYGAFEHIGSWVSHEGDYRITVNNMAINNYQLLDNANLVVCGLAGDYCVKTSIENILRYDGQVELNLEVLKDGVASIDGGKTFEKFIEEKNLKVV